MRDYLLVALTWLSGANCRAPIVAAGPLLPLMMESLHLSATVGGMMTSLPLLVMAALSLPAGLLADRAGPRWLLVFSQGAIALFGALRGFGQSGWAVLGAVLLLGGAVGFSQPALAQIARLRARVTITTAVYVNGMMSGSLVAGLLSGTWLLALAGGLGWRGVFLLWGLFGVLCALLWTRVPLPGSREAAPAAAPAPPLSEVLSMPGMGAISVAFAAQNALFFGYATWSAAYMVSLGHSVAAASVPVVAVSVTSIAGNMIAPHVVRPFGGTRRLLAAASVGAVAAQLGLSVMPHWIALWASVSGLCCAMVFTHTMAMPAQMAGPQRVGAASGFLLLVGYVGAALSPVLMGALLDLTGSFEGSWWLMAGVGAVLVLACFRLPRPAPGKGAVAGA